MPSSISAVRCWATALAVERRGREALRVQAVVDAAGSAGSAICSPSLPANSERPRWTASADSVPPMIEAKLAATYGSSTTGQRRLSGWRAPCSASARSAASCADLLRVEARPGRAPTREPDAGHAIRALAGERVRVRVALGLLVGVAEAVRVGERGARLGCPSRRCPRRCVTSGSRSRAARSTASASSTRRSMVQSPKLAARRGRRRPPRSASRGMPACSSGSVTRADAGGCARQRRAVPPRSGRSRTRSRCARRGTRARRRPSLPASVRLSTAPSYTRTVRSTESSHQASASSPPAASAASTASRAAASRSRV